MKHYLSLPDQCCMDEKHWKATSELTCHAAFLSRLTADTWRWCQESESQAGHRTGLSLGTSGWPHAATVHRSTAPPGIMSANSPSVCALAQDANDVAISAVCSRADWAHVPEIMGTAEKTNKCTQIIYWNILNMFLIVCSSYHHIIMFGHAGLLLVVTGRYPSFVKVYASTWAKAHLALDNCFLFPTYKAHHHDALCDNTIPPHWLSGSIWFI